MKKIFGLILFVLLTTLCGAQQFVVSQNYHTAGGQGTITLTPPNTSLNTYIVGIDVEPCNGTNTTATVAAVTTTGLPGPPQWNVSLPATANTCGPTLLFFPMVPLKSNTISAVTVVTPAGVANATWNLNVYYYFAP